ncbi:MAG: glucosamine-6-phosphate deaminase [Isosphaeraceae bacterium]|nr:glucosamine-6-phosphate deaminase [Isosphaeraceae bacterium]
MDSNGTAEPIAAFSVDALRVLVHADRATMGRAAALGVARAIAERQSASSYARIIFAAAPSQNEFLEALSRPGLVDWTRVVGFHMDEYLGIVPEHPASFRRYLRDRLFTRVELAEDRLRLIPGEETSQPLRTCLGYEDLLRREPTDIVCAGIGENGHLAFNDPPVADFLDPLLVKVVRLDRACREQQVNDGCFATIDDVPTHAYTLTIPALLSAPVVSLCVPGPRKADAVTAALRGPIDESCPASVLRRHAGAILHLDADSARNLI